MSGETIYNILAAQEKKEQAIANSSPYTGQYEKHMETPEKPVYSTFYEKGKEYDGSNARFFKQRDAVIGKNIGETVDPQNFLKRGGGVKHTVAPVPHEKVITKAPLDMHGGAAGVFGNNIYGDGRNDGGLGGGAGDGTYVDEDGNVQRIGGDGSTGGDGTGDQNGNDDYPGKGTYISGQKNFVASNIVEVSNMVPKRNIDQPEYATHRKDFGKNPVYLDRVKGELEQEKEFVRSIEERKAQRQRDIYSQYVFQLNEQERVSLLNKLKQKFKEKSTAYNKMPLSKDTMQGAKRRTELEKHVSDLEEAIKKLDKEAIFVYKDDPVNGQWTKNAAMEAARNYASK
ncbi:hypothetical protein STCU_08860 [Strigomonas culicis]|uniref:Enkurin domain-containing protein n=2 Tax=Strigomonas culicis TaxID=28005 RepID=S9V1H1_9TRYP|nr:hypothetical protein STCU_08860 [Strigomonas culicis]|eukprot:EPY20741.1 hypothetical protein STCU_08860 [Strigomonas culicis]